MVLVVSTNNEASCILCDWKEIFADSLEMEKAVREHLHYDHFRVMVSRVDYKDRVEFTGPYLRNDILTRGS